MSTVDCRLKRLLTKTVCTGFSFDKPIPFREWVIDSKSGKTAANPWQELELLAASSFQIMFKVPLAEGADSKETSGSEVRMGMP